MNDISICIFHGYSDKVVSTDYSQNMGEAFTKARGSPHQTEREGGGHDSSSQACALPWTCIFLLQQERTS
ncbi:MAG: hypothetical protein ACYTGL_11460 [Planctomycetota bacterium]